MLEYNVSSRYAVALMQLAEEKDSFEQISNDIEFVYNTFSKSKELRNIISSPVIDQAKKTVILEEIFSQHIKTDSLNFIKFVIDKNRDDLLFSILRRFVDLRDAKLGIANAEIYCAVDISEDMKNDLAEKLKEYTGKKIKADYKVKESLIGGFKIKIGDKVWDASVSNQLSSLKKTLLSKTV
ncbi:MAG: ATP synthase F1 subunit delta [Ignavibacteria bacterium]|jgi:F-type H+-transporting ATPase subunit delta